MESSVIRTCPSSDLKAKWDAAGIASLDGQIAATARRHRLTVVTRNTTDFAKTGVKVLNPFA